MSLTQTINYDEAGNFTFNSSLIQIMSGAAYLKLISNALQTYNQSFASDSGFTYDSAATEFVGGAVRQKDQRPSNATFFASYNLGINGNWGGGSLTATNNGGVVSGGKLELLGGVSHKYVDYSGTSNADSLQVGCIRIKVIPNYSGMPASVQSLCTLGQDASLANLIVLYHDVNGALSVAIFDSNGSILLSTGFAWSPTSGTEYEIELNWNVTSGATRIFIDGVQLGTTNVNTGVRDGAVNLIRVGEGTILDARYANFSLNELLIFSTVQHTSNYTPGAAPSDYIYLADEISLPAFSYPGVGSVVSFDDFTVTESNSPRYTLNGKYWNGSAWVNSNGSFAQASISSDVAANISTLTVSNSLAIVIYTNDQSTGQKSVSDLTVEYTGQIYPTSNPTIVNNSGVTADALLSLSIDETASGLDAIRHVVLVSNVAKYWDGNSWETSDGTYSQTSTAAEITANIATLDISGGAVVKLKSFLHSGDGSTSPHLTQTVIDYDFFFPAPAEPAKCIVYSYINDMMGIIDSGDSALLTVENSTPFKYGDRIIGPFKRVFAFDADGYCETTQSYLTPSDPLTTDGIVETETVNLSPYTFTISYRNSNGRRVTISTENVQIPNQVSVDLTDLMVFE